MPSGKYDGKESFKCNVATTREQKNILDALSAEDDRIAPSALIRAHFVRPIEKLWDKQEGLQGMTVEQFIRAAIAGLE